MTLINRNMNNNTLNMVNTLCIRPCSGYASISNDSVS